MENYFPRRSSLQERRIKTAPTLGVSKQEVSWPQAKGEVKSFLAELWVNAEWVRELV